MFLIMFLLSFFATDSIEIVFLEFLLSSDLVRHYLAKKEEAAQQQARIAVLQMRPHFIHNSRSKASEKRIMSQSETSSLTRKDYAKS